MVPPLRKPPALKVSRIPTASRIMLAIAHRSGTCVLGAVREPGMPILAIISMDQKTKLASKAHRR
jgi:hypothetical protein